MTRVLFLFVGTASLGSATLARWIKSDRAVRRCYLPFHLASILATGSKSNGCCKLDLKLAALRLWLAAERPDGGGAGDPGSKGRWGDAYNDRRSLVKLNVFSRSQGALWYGGNLSSECAAASVVLSVVASIV